MRKMKIFIVAFLFMFPMIIFGAEKTEIFKVKGMTWPGKAYQVRSTLKKEKGILKVKTDTHKKTVIVTFDNEKIDIEKISKILNKHGFKVIKWFLKVLKQN